LPEECAAQSFLHGGGDIEESDSIGAPINHLSPSSDFRVACFADDLKWG
jgi:hypothetical protein